MFICSPWFQFANLLITFSKTRIFMIITSRTNQMRPVANREHLFTLSLFALKLCLFGWKCILKLRKHTFKNVDKFFLAHAGRVNPSHTADFQRLATWVFKSPGGAPGACWCPAPRSRHISLSPTLGTEKEGKWPAVARVGRLGAAGIGIDWCITAHFVLQFKLARHGVALAWAWPSLL